MRAWTGLTFLVLAVLCLGLAPQPDVNPIRIGVSIGLSGRYAAFGRMYADGLRLWVKKQNANGGILARPVDLIVHDDGSEPKTAIRIYRQMLSSGRFDFVFGPYSSPISKAVVPVLEEYRYPTLMPMTTLDSVWDTGPRYVFGVTTPERRWTRAVFALMAGCNIDRLVILVDDAMFRMGSPRDARKWAKRFGLTILFLESLDTRNLADQLRRARQAGAQGLVAWGYLDDAVAVRRTLTKVGWTPRLFFTPCAPALEEYGRMLGELANYTVGGSVWEPEIGRSYPGGNEFLETFLHEYCSPPSYQAAIGYAAGVILAEAITRAGGTDREKIRQILANLDTVTLIGRYGVDEKGVQIRMRPTIVQWQDGRKRVVWPEDLRAAPLQFPAEAQP